MAIYLSTFIVAFGSLLYEFILAQTASSVLGSTVLQYNLTIGLFVGSLGFGSLCQNWMAQQVSRTTQFIRVEILLAAIGAGAPFVILIADGLNAFAFITYLVTYVLVMTIGFLSGFELPLLMQMGETQHTGSANKVLAADYFGMVAAAIVFPFFILPNVDLFHLALALGILNAGLACFWCLRSQPKILSRHVSTGLTGLTILASLTVITLFILLYYSDNLSHTTIQEFYIAK